MTEPVILWCEKCHEDRGDKVLCGNYTGNYKYWVTKEGHCKKYCSEWMR